MLKLNKLNHFFQLLEVFTIRELKSRYKASLLGPLWIIIYPLSTALILNFVFGTFIKIKTEGVPYFIFVLSGLVVWNFFQQGVNLAKDSLIWDRELITKTSFPINTLPVAFVISKIPDFLIYLILLLVFYSIYSYQANLSYLLTTLIIIPLFLFTAGVSLIAALANAVFRDFGKIVEFLFMILFYATPIIYPESLIPAKYNFVLYLNPLALLITLIRSFLFKADFRPELYLISFLISLFTFIMGVIIFKRFGRKITDLI